MPRTISKLECKRLFSCDLQLIQPKEIIDSSESFISVPACQFKKKIKVAKLIIFNPFLVFENCSIYSTCNYSQEKIKLHIFDIQENEKIIELSECCSIGLKVSD